MVLEVKVKWIIYSIKLKKCLTEISHLWAFYKVMLIARYFMIDIKRLVCLHSHNMIVLLHII